MADSTRDYRRLADDEIPPAFRPWVATSKHAATEITDPCYIDHRAVEDLYFYHPGFRGRLPQLFKHVAAEDPNTKQPWIVVEALSNNWDEKMAEVMWALKFRPTNDPQPVLVAEGIDEAGTRDMHGWLVKGWKVATGRDVHGDKVHQDLIEWTKTVNGQPLQITSLFSWRPYAPLQESSSFVEVSSALQLNDRRRPRTLVLL